MGIFNPGADGLTFPAAVRQVARETRSGARNIATDAVGAETAHALRGLGAGLTFGALRAASGPGTTNASLAVARSAVGGTDARAARRPSLVVGLGETLIAGPVGPRLRNGRVAPRVPATRVDALGDTPHSLRTTTCGGEERREESHASRTDDRS
jgi:hypothetical protein